MAVLLLKDTELEKEQQKLDQKNSRDWPTLAEVGKWSLICFMYASRLILRSFLIFANSSYSKFVTGTILMKFDLLPFDEL